MRHQLHWVELTGTGAMILDCGPDCDPSVTIAGQGANIQLSPLILLPMIPPSEKVTSCNNLINTLRFFRSPEHIQKIRGVFDPGAPLSLVCSSALERPRTIAEQEAALAVVAAETDRFGPRQLALWTGIMANIRLACLLYVNALVRTSVSVEAARIVLQDVIFAHFGADYSQSESPCGLLWSFVYSLQFTNEANVETVRMVHEVLYVIRGCDQDIFEQTEMFLTQVLFSPTVDPVIVDEERIKINIIEGRSNPWG